MMLGSESLLALVSCYHCNLWNISIKYFDSIKYLKKEYRH